MIGKINDFAKSSQAELELSLEEERLLDVFMQLSIRLRFVVMRERDFRLPIHLWAFLFEAAFCVHYDGLIMVEKQNTIVSSLEQLFPTRHKFNTWQHGDWRFFTQKKINSFLQETKFQRTTPLSEVLLAVKDFFELNPKTTFALEVVRAAPSPREMLIETGFRVLTLRLV